MKLHQLLLLLALSFCFTGVQAQGNNDIRDSIIAYAKSYLHVPYHWGGKSSQGFDCSGFTSYVYKNFGYSLSSSAKDQIYDGKRVSIDELKGGDLVFFKGHNSKQNRIGHVGMCVNKEPDGSFNFIHASSGNGSVCITNSAKEYYTKRYVGACNVLEKQIAYLSVKAAPVEEETNAEMLPPVVAEEANGHSPVDDSVITELDTLRTKYVINETHVVQPGETLDSIAEQYHVSVNQIKQWNNFSRKKNSIDAGEKLIIPVTKEEYVVVAKKHAKDAGAKELKKNSARESKPTAQQKQKLSAPNKSTKSDENAIKDVVQYTVKPGDTLRSVAKAFKVNTEDIKKDNNLTGNDINIGQQLVIIIR